MTAFVIWRDIWTGNEAKEIREGRLGLNGKAYLRTHLSFTHTRVRTGHFIHKKVEMFDQKIALLNPISSKLFH